MSTHPISVCTYLLCAKLHTRTIIISTYNHIGKHMDTCQIYSVFPNTLCSDRDTHFTCYQIWREPEKTFYRIPVRIIPVN